MAEPQVGAGRIRVWWAVALAAGVVTVVACGAADDPAEGDDAEGFVEVTYDENGLDQWGFTEEEGRFLELTIDYEVEMFPDLASAPDTTVLSDDELVAAGHDFCDLVSGGGDREAVVEGPLADQLAAVNRDGVGRPLADGPVQAAQIIAAAAQEGLCPDSA